MCAAMQHVMKMAANVSDTASDDITSSHGREERGDTGVYLYPRIYRRIEQMKSESRTTYVLLILSFSVYRCHGTIDFTEN